ncbi:MAG: TonB-dependent receptor [Chitinophagaceae bacterium]|nr:MAG: TonB-dependent receptor [Chitinophagaceae bacterium]
MLKKLSLALLLLILSYCSFAQTNTISGVVKDTTENKFVHNAVVALLSQQDSILITFARTNAQGTYSLASVPHGKYIFMVMHPSFADYVEDKEIDATNSSQPMIAVTPKSKLLEAIIIQSGNPIRIKGDTTIYTADSFKVSANANVEELLKKMPGIQVDKNGTIKAMGETVEKVLVDGEEFFGDDPGMAVKNLRADAVKEVQVFQKKSDQAEFTGIDDGQSKQTINLKLKEDKKKGYFGKIDAAGGLQNDIADRYNTNFMFSSFKGKRKFSSFLLTGNTGQDGLSWQDMERYGSTGEMSMEMTDEGGMMFFSRGGDSDGEPYINTRDGYIKNINAGLQYSNKWNDTKTFNISPKFNSQLYDNNKLNFTQTRIGDSLLNENATTNSLVDRYNFKTNASYEIKIDSNNTLKLTLGANIYHTESDELRRANTTGAKGNLINTSNRKLATTSDREALNGTALFKHKFKKARRTLSLNASWNMLNNDMENYLQSDNQSFDNGVPVLNQQQNQLRDIEKQTTVFSSKLVYTEPLNKDFSLELGHEVSLNNGTNNQVTYTYSNTTGKYDVLVDSLTNNFDQRISIQKPSVKA